MIPHFVLFFQTHIFRVENISCEFSFCKDYIKYYRAFKYYFNTGCTSVDSLFWTYKLNVIIFGVFREFLLIQSRMVSVVSDTASIVA